MHRIIHGTLYERQPQACGHKVRIHDLGHGHVEVVALPHYQWREVADLSPLALANHADECLRCELDAPSVLEQELADKANRERSTRRARTTVRRLAKHKGLTVLLTLTYRENMTDRDRMQRDFDVFMKRLRRVARRRSTCVSSNDRNGGVARSYRRSPGAESLRLQGPAGAIL